MWKVDKRTFFLGSDAKFFQPCHLYNTALEDLQEKGKGGGLGEKAKNKQITDVKMLFFHITKSH